MLLSTMLSRSILLLSKLRPYFAEDDGHIGHMIKNPGPGDGLYDGLNTSRSVPNYDWGGMQYFTAKENKPILSDDYIRPEDLIRLISDKLGNQTWNEQEKKWNYKWFHPEHRLFFVDWINRYWDRGAKLKGPPRVPGDYIHHMLAKAYGNVPSYQEPDWNPNHWQEHLPEDKWAGTIGEPPLKDKPTIPDAEKEPPPKDMITVHLPNATDTEPSTPSKKKYQIVVCDERENGTSIILQICRQLKPPGEVLADEILKGGVSGYKYTPEHQKEEDKKQDAGTPTEIQAYFADLCGMAKSENATIARFCKFLTTGEDGVGGVLANLDEYKGNGAIDEPDLEERSVDESTEGEPIETKHEEEQAPKDKSAEDEHEDEHALEADEDKDGKKTPQAMAAEQELKYALEDIANAAPQDRVMKNFTYRTSRKWVALKLPEMPELLPGEKLSLEGNKVIDRITLAQATREGKLDLIEPEDLAIARLNLPPSQRKGLVMMHLPFHHDPTNGDLYGYFGLISPDHNIDIMDALHTGSIILVRKRDLQKLGGHLPKKRIRLMTPVNEHSEHAISVPSIDEHKRRDTSSQVPLQSMDRQPAQKQSITDDAAFNLALLGGLLVLMLGFAAWMLKHMQQEMRSLDEHEPLLVDLRPLEVTTRRTDADEERELLKARAMYWY